MKAASTRKREQLLARLAAIPRMERGKLCRMGERPFYNHQTWENGHNVVRYVPATDLDALREAIAGYQLFQELTAAYAEEVIRLTRNERKKPRR